jgi:site-specific recombinase XerD
MSIKEYLQKRYSPSTLSGNLYNIKKFTDYYQGKAEKATYQDVLQYIEYLRKNHDLHAKTLRHCLYAVKIYFNYLLETGKRNDHPCSELYLKDKINKQIQVDNLYSIQTLENFLDTHTLKRKKQLQKRNEIMISLLIYQALTSTEIAELETGNINLEKGEIYIKGSQATTAKSPKSRTLPLQAKQVLLFYNYLKEDRLNLLKYNKENPAETAFILGQYGEKVNAHCISKMINENRPKSQQIQPIRIRQSVIAHLLKKENDTRVVQVFAGHRKASTTVQYKQTQLEALQSAVNQYHPLQ